MTDIEAPEENVFEKTLWEKEKMLVTAFSPFPTMFYIFQIDTALFEPHWNCYLQMLWIWTL